jgi:hypothetical protein
MISRGADFGDEAERTELERPHHVRAVLHGRQDDDRKRRMALAQLGEQGKALAVR